MTPTLLPKTRFHKSFKIQLYTIEYLANCLDKGIYPDNLEYAAIIPIFWNKDRKDKNNYRPVFWIYFLKISTWLYTTTAFKPW